MDRKKTATCSLFQEYLDNKEAIPEIGERSIILDGNDQPWCVIELTKVQVIAFEEVDADFARKEGEGDLSLIYWRTTHTRFFTRIFPEFHGGMKIVCEEFEMIHHF